VNLLEAKGAKYWSFVFLFRKVVIVYYALLCLRFTWKTVRLT
jgi:hypothetical protein